MMVRKLAASVEFYREMLGFECVAQLGEPQPFFALLTRMCGACVRPIGLPSREKIDNGRFSVSSFRVSCFENRL